MPRGIGPAAITAVLLSLAAGACGSARAIEADVAEQPSRNAVIADANFLASDVIHEITVEFEPVDYAELIAAYEIDQSKDWITATITIDGITYYGAGMRLKGNSSLFGIAGAGVRPGPSGNSDAEEPESLPWLIRLDKYIDGQSHNGISDIVVRSNNSATALNEAVALDLLELAGLASQDSAYASFSVNGSSSVLRLVMEHPDEVWMTDELGSAGSLYKAESTGDYSYRGDDPSAYDEVFDLEAGVDEDLVNLTDFLDFINNADDETFYGELDTRLDTDAFAVYLAMQDLISNPDDIDGRGNNSYLYYDTTTARFTVVPWDHNLAFGVLNGANGAPSPPEAGRRDTSLNRAEPGGGLIGGPDSGLEVANILVERFLANAQYAEMYVDATAELKASLFESGTAADVLAEWVALLQAEATDLVSSAIIQSEANSIAGFFE
jgi:spore coat protein CotH